MEKELLQTIDGITLYPIISLLIFFLFFAGLVIWVIKVDKKYLAKMENLPIEGRDENEFEIEKGETL